MTICMLGGMDIIIRLIFELIIKINIIKMSNFPEPGRLLIFIIFKNE